MGCTLGCGWYSQSHSTGEYWFPFSNRYQVQIASWLGMRLITFPLLPAGICRAQICTCLLCVGTVPISSCVYQPCLSPLLDKELSLKRRALIKIFLLVLNAPWTLIVCTLSTSPSQSWDSACPEPVQVLWVLPPFLWNDMSICPVVFSWKTPFPQGHESHLALRIFLTPL